MALNQSIQPIYDELARLRQSWVGGGWSWDSRLSCVSSSFGTDLTSEARSVVTSIFPNEFNHRTVRKAPPVIQEIAEQTGGVRSDQLILSSQTVRGTLAFGLWWPWGDDVTISFRVGLAGLRATAEMGRLQEEFGATF